MNSKTPKMMKSIASTTLNKPYFHCNSSRTLRIVGQQIISHRHRSRLFKPTRTSINTSRSLYSTMSAGKYPSRDEISRLFDNMADGDYAAFFEKVSPQVDWTVMGTHPCAGRYTTLEDFQKGTLARLAKIMKDPGLKLRVRNVIGGGDQEWATVELVANAECLNGESNHFLCSCN